MNDVPRCQHVKVNGTQCGSPALRRRRFCYFHNSYRETQAKLLDEQSQVRICNLPLLEDANSVQVAVMQVIHLLGAGKIDTKVAGLMLYALQTAAANLKRVSFEAEKPTDVVIDQDKLDLTCLNGPQWFARDFEELEETTAGRAKLRKKPDPMKDTPDLNSSLAGMLLQRLGIAPKSGENAAENKPESKVREPDEPKPN
jgi:hypothetical protein